MEVHHARAGLGDARGRRRRRLHPGLGRLLPQGQREHPHDATDHAAPDDGTARACTATYRIVSQWTGGFQAEVTVRAGTAALNGWTVGWTFANGQRVTQIWSGTATSSGSSVSVRNVGYNGSVPANGSTTFGFLGSWTGANAVPTPITCARP